MERLLNRQALFSGLVLLGAVALDPISAAASGSTEIIALNNTSTPDGEQTFIGFVRPSLNNQEQVNFTGALLGLGNYGIYLSDGAGGLSEVAQSHEPAPNTEGVFYSRFHEPLVSTTGHTLFMNSTEYRASRPYSSLRQSLFLSDGLNAPELVVEIGDAAPNGNGTFEFINGEGLNASGQVVFYGQLTGATGSPSTDQGIFIRDSASSPTRVARSGQAFGPASAAFESFWLRPRINDAGHVAFIAELTNTPGGNSDDTGIFISRTPGGLTTIAREGDTVPNGDGTFSDLDFNGNHLSMNNSGQVAFRGLLSGTGSREGLFVGDGVDPLRTIARFGDSAPDGDGTIRLVSSPVINDTGQIAFWMQFQNTSGQGLGDNGYYLSSPSGAIERVVRLGQQAPGGGTFAYLSWMALNNAGQVAFVSELNAFGSGERGLFLFDPEDGLTEIVRVGDTFLGSTIDFLLFAENNASYDIENGGLNDHGQVAFDFHLADGRNGIALWTPTLTGDLNGDGAVTNGDISAFVMALIDPTAFASAFPDVDPDEAGDFSGDGLLTNGDIAGFVDALTASPSLIASAEYEDLQALAVPEPASFALLGLGGLAMMSRRRRCVTERVWENV